MRFEVLTILQKFCEQQFVGKDKNPTELALHQYFLVESLVALSLVLVLLMIATALRTPIMIEYCLTFLLLGGSLSFIATRIFTKVEHHILLQQLLTIGIVTFYTAEMGGLLTSGGIIFLGSAPVLKTLVFKNLKKMISVYSLFIACVIFLIVFDDQFEGKNLLTSTQNKFYFGLNLMAITSYIFLFAGYAQHMFTKLAHQEALRQKEINKAKNRLYTNITHEFRTPLSVILAVADSLNEQKDETLQAKANTLTRNGRNLLQLIDNLLDLNKLESGNLRLSPSHGNIIPILKDTFQLQEYAAKQKKLRFLFKAQRQSCLMDFDVQKIRTIVTNLVSNAIKFTPDGGYVLMRVTGDEKFLSFFVHDNGIGIPQHQQQKIFERFYQVDDSDSRPAEGSGIGLALTKELVELLKGQISLSSTPGKTVFKVKLPITTDSSSEHSVATQDLLLSPAQHQTFFFSNGIESTSSERYNLLIAEDNADLIGYLKDCFETQYEIQTASNGLEAKNKAVQLIPDLIISDVMMPKMDGFTLCKKLKEDFRTSHIPIILLTAKADMPSRIEGLEQGADAYIAKPFSQEELVVRMKNLLELRRKLHERYASGNVSQLAPTQAFIREDQFMVQVTEIINQQLADENFNVPILCQEMAMSKSQLYRKFSALTNMSAARYIRKLRMQRAKNLLLTTSMNMTEISYEVGIKTLSTFSEIFKDEFGASPSEYLNHWIENHRIN